MKSERVDELLQKGNQFILNIYFVYINAQDIVTAIIDNLIHNAQKLCANTPKKKKNEETLKYNKGENITIKNLHELHYIKQPSLSNTDLITTCW